MHGISISNSRLPTVSVTPPDYQERVFCLIKRTSRMGVRSSIAGFQHWNAIPDSLMKRLFELLLPNVHMKLFFLDTLITK